MTRHWRCANEHGWIGDLGALTYCPECGSADVFEVRPPRAAESSLEQTWAQEAPEAAAGSANVADEITLHLPGGNITEGGTLRCETPVASGSPGSTAEFVLPSQQPAADPPPLPDERPTVRAAVLPPSERPTVAARKPAAPPRGLPDVEGYELLGVLGRGGMGVVYKARQKGLNRLVALKVILGGAHAGAADKERFRAEAEAVAALQHPNIVQIYDVGERDGLPFFSLEFVDGGSLLQQAGGQPVAPRRAAECAERLALAVQYAHERGIVHRDLKPANILLQRKPEIRNPKSDDSPISDFGFRISDFVPKVSDFGLAKRVADDSRRTGTGAILGTPSYMSPEQASGRAGEVGPPTDIYALGAILYELLTGRPPFQGADPTDTILKVRTTDPTPPRRLRPKVPRDLDTVCLKCLEKEPRKRYATAGELAADLRRFLDGQPVHARPTPPWETAWKWARRRPAAAALVALLAGAAVGGPALAYREMARANREEALRLSADRQRERALRNFHAARDAVGQLLTRVGAERLRDEPRLERLRAELLEQALLFYNRFLDESGDLPELRQEAGWAYQRVGQIRDLLGQRSAAIDAFRASARLFDHLADQFPATLAYQSDRADSYRLLAVALEADRQYDAAERAARAAQTALGRLADNPAARRQLGELLNNRGIQLSQRDQLGEAAEALRAARDQFASLAADDPAEPDYQVEWAKVETNLSTVLMGHGQPRPAAETARAAVDRLTALTAGRPPRTAEHARELGRASANLAGILARSGQLEEAQQVGRDAIRVLTGLVKDFPEAHEYRFALALAHNNLALVLQETHGRRAAEPERAAARELLKRLAGEHPRSVEYRYQYALSLDESAISLQATDRLAEATAAARAATDLLGQLVREDPIDTELHFELARRHLNLGQLFAQARDADEAEANYDRSAALLEELRVRRAVSDAVLAELAVVHTNRALVMRDLGRPREEETRWKQVARLQEALVASQPARPEPRVELARTRATLAALQMEEPGKALASLREAVRGQREAVRLAPGRADLVPALGAYGAALVEGLMNTGDHAAAARSAADLGRDLPASAADWPRIAGSVARCMRLAREDPKLPAEQRTNIANGYGAQALAILRRAVAAGFKDRPALEESADLAALRSGAFRAEFDELVKQMTQPPHNKSP